MIAAHKKLGKQATATINLTSDPWQGIGVYVLGLYLFLVFSLVTFLIGLVPSSVPNVTALKAEQDTAAATLQAAKAAMQAAQESTHAAPDQGGGTMPSAQGKTPATPQTGRGKATTDGTDVLAALKQQFDTAERNYNQARDKVVQATAPDVKTYFFPTLDREIDYLLLVLIAGALGAFLHIAQSFSDFAGNQALKKSWVWWYAFRPFVGAGLALLLYAVLRGGLVTLSVVSPSDATSVNPYGLIGAGALAGMFSKAATTKLGEVFDNLFQSSKANQTKDKLAPGGQGTNPPSGSGSAPASGASAAGK